MLISCWSAKGGSGTTVVSVALALLLARSAPSGALLVDLGGDVPAALGVPEPDGAGVLDWLAAGPDTPADALARLERVAAPGLAVLPRGSGRAGQWALAGDLVTAAVASQPQPGRPVAADPRPIDANGGHPAAGVPVPPPVVAHRPDLLAGVLAADPRPVVADCGTLAPDAAGAPATTVAASASVSLLVLRPCYLALRRATAAALRPSSVVLVGEPGRSLGRREIEDVLGVPVRAEVPWDPAVARAVDAGLLAARLPRSLARSLRGAA